MTDQFCDSNKVLEVIVKYHSNDMDKVERFKNGDWIDLRSAEEVILKAGDFKIISLGISMKVPAGYEAHIAPRSSTFKNFGVLQTNGVGVIDESYCGDNDVWGMPVLAMRDTVIHRGDRICQFRLMPKMGPVKFTETDYMYQDSRGGFGSTGVA